MNLTSLLWIGPPLVLQALLLRILLKTHKYKVFPCFFAYTGFSVVADLARLAVYNTDRLYFYVYWISEVGYAVLGIAVMYEVYRAVFPGFRTFWWFRPIFPVIVLFTTVITIIHMMGLPGWTPSAIHELDRSGRVVGANLASYDFCTFRNFGDFFRFALAATSLWHRRWIRPLRDGGAAWHREIF